MQRRVSPDTSSLIVNEGEFKAMAVSLSNGSRSLPAEFLALLEWFNEVRLWMDHDGPGRKGAEKFTRKLGVERCLVVWPSGRRGWHGEV